MPVLVKKLKPGEPAAARLVAVESTDAPMVSGPDPNEVLVSQFLEPREFGAACREVGWDTRREVQILSGLAEDPGQPGRVRIAAAEALRRRAIENLRLSGRLATLVARRTEEQDGGVTEELRIVGSIQRRTSDLLESSVDSSIVTDVGPADPAESAESADPAESVGAASPESGADSAAQHREQQEDR